MKLTEHRRTAKGLADLLLYSTLVDDGVLLLQDGALLATWSFRGPDMASATNEEMAALSARLNSTLRLGSGWMVHCDAIRSRAPEYPAFASFPDAATRMIDDERRQQFLEEGAHFESEYFLSLTYLPPAESEERFKGWMFEGTRQARSAASRALDHFQARVASFEDVFTSLFKVRRLRMARADGDADRHPRFHDELLRFVRRCIGGDDYPFELPEIPVDLNEHLACADFVGGLEPRIGSRHIRVIAIDGFPRMSFPGILGALDALPIEYRWNTRAILLDPEEARSVLDKTRKKWRAKMRGWKDQLLRTESGAVNLYAHEMAEDAEEAMGVAASGDVYFAQYTSVVICSDENEARLDETAGLVIKTIRNLGFGCRLETVNAIEAWRGSLPGDGYRNVRRVLLHTLNISDLLPITAVWAGERENPSPLMPPGSPPLLYGATTGATPFRFNIHVGDLGHALMVGPPGAGKSTFLGTVAAQWFRYPNAQVFAFDKGYSLFVLTHAAGGEFYDIGGESTDWAFCPLRDIDTPAEVAWAVDWLESLCQLQGFSVTPKERNALLYGVQALQNSPSRTLTELLACIPAVLEQDINSDLPGETRALVREDVYDTASGKFLLIPQGSRLVGHYNSQVAYGQSGLQVVWARIIFPDASSIDLNGMSGEDAAGRSGFRDKVDNHYKRLLGFGLLTSVFAAALQISQNHNGNVLTYPSNGELAAGAVGQQMATLGADVTRRNLNVQPTIKIDTGYRFNVRVNRDLAFEAPYRPLRANSPNTSR